MTSTSSHLSAVIEQLCDQLTLSPQQRHAITERLTNGATVIEALSDVANDAEIAATLDSMMDRIAAPLGELLKSGE